MITKICSHCKKELEIKEFPKNKNEKNGYYHYCKSCKREINKKWYLKIKDNPIFIKKQKIYTKWYNKYFKQKRLDSSKKQRIKLREIIFSHYGKKCICCGENDLFALTIDHINNDGNKHRKTMPAGYNFYRWLINHNFPKGLQVLCWNCNEIKRLNNGIIPEWRINKYLGVKDGD
jgi:hypothetical protein